jgi:hypothetical protein
MDQEDIIGIWVPTLSLYFRTQKFFKIFVHVFSVLTFLKILRAFFAHHLIRLACLPARQVVMQYNPHRIHATFD